ncbi:PRD domain-containing protein [Paenibacillus taiwanensis]|uniref:PRD domain-containing protein n=1 Tax=Paenibacillus taiwanensis TaxID=401638 RepID=UPI0003F4D09D|nr:PRD domain-containing protein [Paenibacillus taiwanensis]
MLSDERRFEIIRALSNNVVLANDVWSNKETILMGKGIGFGAKPSASIEHSDARIEKKFSLASEQHLSQYQMILEQIDAEVIMVSERIISLVSEQLTPDLNEHIHLALPSHIEYALYRIRHDISIENPFLWEIRTLNPKEYEVATQAAELIGSAFGIVIPEDEIGFLTIHIQSAVAHVPVGNVVQYNHLLKELVVLIEERRGSQIPKDSIDYLRLITHLRFAIERIRQGEHSRNPFRDKLMDMVPYEFGVAKECGALMAKTLNMNVSDDEVAYIAMHLYRLFQKDFE